MYALLLVRSSGEFLERVLAGKVDAALLVDLGDLDPGHIADVENVLDLLGALELEVLDVAHAVLARGGTTIITVVSFSPGCLKTPRKLVHGRGLLPIVVPSFPAALAARG